VGEAALRCCFKTPILCRHLQAEIEELESAGKIGVDDRRSDADQAAAVADLDDRTRQFVESPELHSCEHALAPYRGPVRHVQDWALHERQPSRHQSITCRFDQQRATNSKNQRQEDLKSESI